MKYSNIVLIISTIFLFSCESQSEKEDKAANRLLRQASEQIALNSPVKALELLDSIHKSFPKQVAIRRMADELQDTVEWRDAQRNLNYCDSLSQIRTVEFENLKKEFRFEKNEKYQDKGLYKHLTFLQANEAKISSYVDETGLMFVQIMHNGNPIGLKEIRLFSNGQKLISPQHGDGNYHQFSTDGQSFEQLIISGESAKELIVYITNNELNTVTLGGLKGSKDIRILPSDRKAFIQTGKFAQVYTEVLNFEKEMKRLNNKIFTIESK